MEKWPNSETNAPDGEKSVDGKSELFEKKENLHAAIVIKLVHLVVV